MLGYRQAWLLGDASGAPYKSYSSESESSRFRCRVIPAPSDFVRPPAANIGAELLIGAGSDTCPNSPFSASSVTFPLTWPCCPILTNRSSTCPASCGRVSDIRDNRSRAAGSSIATIILRFISSCACARSRAAWSSPCCWVAPPGLESWGLDGAEGRKPGGS